MVACASERTATTSGTATDTKANSATGAGAAKSGTASGADATASKHPVSTFKGGSPNEPSLIQQGDFMVIDKNYKAAEILYKRAIEKYPTSPIPYTSLGDLYMRQEKYEDAERSYLEAVRVKPTNQYGWAQLSSLRVRKGDFQGGKEAADRANELK